MTYINLPPTGGGGGGAVDSVNGQTGTVIITASGLGAEVFANKSTSVATDQASNTKYPSVKAVYDWAVATFQAALGFTPENVSNKDNGALSSSTTTYPTSGAVTTALGTKATDSLVVHLSGTESVTGLKTFTKRAISSISVLTSGSAVAVDASLSNTFGLTAATNFTLSNPTNAVDGQRIMFIIRQDATGSRVMTLDTKFRFTNQVTAAVLSTAAAKVDYLGVVYNATDDKFDVVAFTRGA